MKELLTQIVQLINELNDSTKPRYGADLIELKAAELLEKVNSIENENA
jgi:hypothetical protein